MGLGYTPLARVGGAYAELINERLLNWELVDASGRQSDQLTLRVDTDGIDGIPKQGQVINFEVGYVESESLTDKGQYKIVRVKPRLYPDSVTIVATAAPFEVNDKTAFKQRQSRSFEGVTVGEIFRQLVKTHGFSPRIAADLDTIVIEHIDQSDETDMSFLTRLAKKYDAVVKPVDNFYIMAQRGKIKSLSGQSIESVEFSLPAQNNPRSSSFINIETDDSGRSRYRGVKTRYWDAGQSREIDVVAGDPPYKKHRQKYDSQQQAKAVADGDLKKLVRSGVKIKMDIPGDPRLASEGLIILDRSFPEYMAGRWSIDRVISRGDRGQSYRCTVEATEPL